MINTLMLCCKQHYFQKQSYCLYVKCLYVNFNTTSHFESIKKWLKIIFSAKLGKRESTCIKNMLKCM